MRARPDMADRRPAVEVEFGRGHPMQARACQLERRRHFVEQGDNGRIERAVPYRFLEEPALLAQNRELHGLGRCQSYLLNNRIISIGQ